ncbi:MAG: Xaa-Pro peptidase family protein [Actinomycetota bacterium]
MGSDLNLWPIDPVTANEYLARTAAVRASAEAQGLDGVIAYSNAKITANVRYLTSYYTRFAGHQHTLDDGYYMFGSCAALIPLAGTPFLRTDALWDVVRAQEMSEYTDVAGSTGLGKDLGRAIGAQKLRRVGIDNWHIFPAHDYLALQAGAPDTEFVPTLLISDVRAVKSPAELERIRRSERIADAAVIAGMDAVAPGVTEYEVGLVAEEMLRRLGDFESAGGSIISAGANSASGSSLPTREKVIERGEWVLLDVLPRFDGYAGDIARMRFAGEPDDLTPELAHLHAATLLMNREVVKAVRAGITARELNAVAVAVACQEGVQDHKIELLGHGIGLDVHDMPDYYYDDTPLRVGEVITIEPCLLKEGVAGTRIEDVVAVEADGCEVLTNAARGLFAETRAL